jgi:hypothetical protein
MNNIVFEIPVIKKDLFNQVFHLASLNPSASAHLKSRIMNFFIDLTQQRRENHKLIYTTYSKDQIKEFLLDLKELYKNTDQVTKLTKLEGLIIEMREQ